MVPAAVGGGKIYVSTYLADILKKKQTASVLITGIERIEGNFRKNEVVEIYNDENKIIWYDKKTDIEKSKIKAADIVAVHYDYFSFV